MDLTKIDNIQIEGVSSKDYPDFADAYIVSADYNGKEMTERQLDEINENQHFVNIQVLKSIF